NSIGAVNIKEKMIRRGRQAIKLYPQIRMELIVPHCLVVLYCSIGANLTQEYNRKKGIIEYAMPGLLFSFHSFIDIPSPDFTNSNVIWLTREIQCRIAGSSKRRSI